MRVHRCPKCKDKGRHFGFNLLVMALVKCAFQQTFPTNFTKKTTTSVIVPSSEPSWSGESMMECGDCGHIDRAIEFAWSEYWPETEPLRTEEVSVS
jgi:hypothetical protein